MSVHPLDRLVTDSRSGVHIGVTSVCTANPTVLEATVRHGAAGEHLVLIEATCNQVNQDGGYTGMTAEDFFASVTRMADQGGLPGDRLVLGGDHLGPNPWRNEPASVAMDKSETLVRSFVAAGFTKIHLDCSMRCSDDSEFPLEPDLIASRAARLAEAAEDEALRTGARTLPRYVIGTEVPVPGGAESADDAIEVTTAENLRSTIDLHRNAFTQVGVETAWERVIAVVTQPGVEFSGSELHEYDQRQAQHLVKAIESEGNLVFEAHSTDYQTVESLTEMVRDHFAILKVGPGLTFAYREAVFALSMIEDELFGSDASHVRDVLDRVMVERPGHWTSYYKGDKDAMALARRFSLSDRSRYYWPERDVQDALEAMHDNLGSVSIPLPLVSQYLPGEYGKIREADINPDSDSMVAAKIITVLEQYLDATKS